MSFPVCVCVCVRVCVGVCVDLLLWATAQIYFVSTSQLSPPSIFTLNFTSVQKSPSKTKPIIPKQQLKKNSFIPQILQTGCQGPRF